MSDSFQHTVNVNMRKASAVYCLEKGKIKEGMEHAQDAYDLYHSDYNRLLLNRFDNGQLDRVIIELGKKGNDKYYSDIRRRLAPLNEYLYSFKDKNVSFIQPIRGSKYYHAHALFFSLLINEKKYTVDESWKCGEKEYNRYITTVRKMFPGCEVCKVKEAHLSGYLHFHFILLLKKPVVVKKHRDKSGRVSYRLTKAHLSNVKALWVDKVGFEDVKAVRSLGGVRYLVKYQQKMGRLNEFAEIEKDFGYPLEYLIAHKEETASIAKTLPKAAVSKMKACLGILMSWLFRKKILSLSKKFLPLLMSISEAILSTSNSNNKKAVDDEDIQKEAKERRRLLKIRIQLLIKANKPPPPDKICWFERVLADFEEEDDCVTFWLPSDYDYEIAKMMLAYRDGISCEELDAKKQKTKRVEESLVTINAGVRLNN